MGAYKEVPWVAGEELLECPAVPALCAPSASAFLLMLKDTFGPVGQLYDTYFRKGPFTFIWEYGIGCVICMVSQLSHYFLLKLFTNIPIRAALESTGRLCEILPLFSVKFGSTPFPLCPWSCQRTRDHCGCIYLFLFVFTAVNVYNRLFYFELDLSSIMTTSFVIECRPRPFPQWFRLYTGLRSVIIIVCCYSHITLARHAGQGSLVSRNCYLAPASRHLVTGELASSLQFY